MMNSSEMNIIENICKYCLNKYQISNHAPILSTLIYQLGRQLDIDVPAVRGMLYVDINNYRRAFAHCFNVYNSKIIDVSIYQFALLNQSIEKLFPLYICGNTPLHIDYIANNEIKYSQQFKFRDEELLNILKEINQTKEFPLNRFSLLEDSKKLNLIF